MASELELLADLEMSRYRWDELNEIRGSARFVPGSIRALLRSQTPEEAGNAYWQLENYVVVQGQLYEAAVPTTKVIMAALVAERARFVRIALLELLYQIVSGEAERSEAARGLGDLGDRCRAAAREGLWLLYRELVTGERDAAREVIERVETDSGRLAGVESRIVVRVTESDDPR